MFAPKGSLAGRVARCDDDDDWDECPPPDRSFLFELAVTTGVMGIVTAVAEMVKERGRDRRERMRQDGRSERQRTRIDADADRRIAKRESKRGRK